MTIKITSSAAVCLFISTSVLCLSGTATAQLGADDGQWPSYAADSGSTKYTSLDQIDASNFSQLQMAWRWDSPDADLNFDDVDRDVSFGRLQGKPLMIDGVLYMITSLNQIESGRAWCRGDVGSWHEG